MLARKTVTILFCDVADSTPLGERLDPESLQRVMARWFAEARAVIEHHGGTVEKFIGDEVMAVFGVPTIHEDDALRAVRAAAEMRNRLEALNEQFETDFGVRVAVRMGVNTGEVVAGDPSGGATFVTGEAVNVAKRLEQAAQAGEILMGKATYPLVRDAVRAGPLESFPVKGKQEPVAKRRLDRIDATAAAIARRLDTPLIDRANELLVLQETFERAVRERTCQQVTILGAAGIGKSRLAGELLASVGGRATVLTGRCLPYGDGITFWPLVEIVRTAVGDQNQLDDLLGDADDADAIAAGVRGALGTATAPGTSQETFWAVRRLIETIAAQRALAVCFEDIHWADPTFLDLIEYLAGWIRDVPLLILCLARPDLLESRPTWANPSPQATLLSLGPLSESDSGMLVDVLAGDAGLVESRRTEIADAAEGNPLFLEQMLALSAEEGADAEFAVPGSIQALLAERLDRLGAAERVVLECASVVGRDFPRGAAVDLCPAELQASVGSHLLSLARKELIRPDRSPFAREDGFRFRHALIRDAAYQGMPKETRGRLHERVADWLLAHSEGAGLKLDELLGYHLEQAFHYRDQLGLLDDPARAVASRAAGHLAVAGRRAFARGDAPAAATLMTRATILLHWNTDDRLALAPELGEALLRAGELAQSTTVLARAIDAAGERGDRVLESRARIVMGEVLLLKGSDGKVQEVERDAEEALTVFAEVRDELGLAGAWHLLSNCRSQQSQFGEAERLLREALTHAERAGDARKRGSILVGLAHARYLGPTPVAEAIMHTRELFDGKGESLVVQAEAAALLGGLEAMCGRFVEARQLCARSRLLLEEELGERFWLAGARFYFGSMELLAGDSVAAERELLAGYRVVEELGASAELANLAAALAEAELAQGRLDDAQRYVHVSREASSRDDAFSQIAWRRTEARLLLRRNDLERAAQVAREAVTIASATDCLNAHADALVALAEVESAAGATRAAREAFDVALGLYEAKGNVAAIAQSAASPAFSAPSRTVGRA